MADDQSMTVRAAASKLLVEEHADVLREAVRVMLGEVMEAEVSSAAGADWYERSDERVASITSPSITRTASRNTSAWSSTSSLLAAARTVML